MLLYANIYHVIHPHPVNYTLDLWIMKYVFHFVFIGLNAVCLWLAFNFVYFWALFLSAPEVPPRHITMLQCNC